jgi:hypothetical protein
VLFLVGRQARCLAGHLTGEDALLQRDHVAVDEFRDQILQHPMLFGQFKHLLYNPCNGIRSILLDQAGGNTRGRFLGRVGRRVTVAPPFAAATNRNRGHQWFVNLRGLRDAWSSVQDEPDNAQQRVIVTTTINPPSEAIELFDSFEDFSLIVIGDKKTPSDHSRRRGVYVSVTSVISPGTMAETALDPAIFPQTGAALNVVSGEGRLIGVTVPATLLSFYGDGRPGVDHLPA